MVVTVTTHQCLPAGAVYEAADGTRFILRATATHDEAEAVAREAGPEARIFAVRPYWGMPAREWIAADPDFWSCNPMAKAR